jgi:hypothetical protein
MAANANRAAEPFAAKLHFITRGVGRLNDWIRNLRKNPRVEVTRDGAVVSGTAEVVEELGRKRQIVSENPLVIFPFRIVRAIAFGPMRPITVGLLRRWVTSRPVVVIRT